MYATFLWTSTFPKHKPLVVYQFLLHGIIILPEATSSDNIIKVLNVCLYEHVHSSCQILYDK